MLALLLPSTAATFLVFLSLSLPSTILAVP